MTIINPEERETLRQVAHEAFQKTDLTRLTQLCGFTEAGYEALLDSLADEILSAGLVQRDVEETT